MDARKITRLLRSIQHRIRMWSAERAIRQVRHKAQKAHGLPGDLVVTLTSYPARFATLHKTLRSLLSQTVRADRTVLWIAEDDLSDVPDDVRQLKALGLEICSCPDLRSYKKIIPALKLWPEAFIVTADDDLYYPPDWLETLVEGVVRGEKIIICRRAHLPLKNEDGFAPYEEWQWDFVADGEIRGDLFPTTGAGVLYPPGSLPTETLDVDSFRRLCPTADDVWMFWMGRINGASYRQVGGGFPQVSWTGSQSATLASVNCDGGNDEQLRAVCQCFPVVD